MSVFAANNNQQYASFSSGVNCFSFHSPHSRSMFVLNCLCANIFSTVSSLPWAFCYYCLYALCGLSIRWWWNARILSILLCLPHCGFTAIVSLPDFFRWFPPSQMPWLLLPLLYGLDSCRTHFCVHAFPFIFKHSKSFKVVILVALVPCEWILQNNKIIYTMIRFSCNFFLLVSAFSLVQKSSSDNPILIEMIEPRCEWCWQRWLGLI